jgi:hypothetical protein
MWYAEQGASISIKALQPTRKKPRAAELSRSRLQVQQMKPYREPYFDMVLSFLIC